MERKRKVARLYELTIADKEIIEQYLHSEVTGNEAAAYFKMTRQNFKGMVATIVKKMVTEGVLDFSKQLKSY